MKTRIDTLIFDLDGTLTNSRPRWLAAIKQAVLQAGFAMPPEQVLLAEFCKERFTVFADVFGADEAQSAAAMKHFVAAYDTHVELEQLYAGILPYLAQLQQAGIRMFICTARAYDLAQPTVDNLGLADYITDCFCSVHDIGLTDKAQVLKLGMQAYDLQSEQCIFIGDRATDIIAAGKNGMPGIGVDYDASFRAELLEAGAAAVAGSLDELKRIVADYIA
ncbi:HAD hydrolase-like protein [Eubacteriales bacterium OttesenSCG-928-N14]|nr:HAD hydrolase-like protein [Eubacteriales bacterium OttesenSCG-928-N14]